MQNRARTNGELKTTTACRLFILSRLVIQISGFIQESAVLLELGNLTRPSLSIFRVEV